MQTRFYANFVFQKYSIISFVCELKKKKKSRINIYGVLILKLVGREKAPRWARQDECQLDFMRISFYVFHEYLIFSFICEFKKKKSKTVYRYINFETHRRGDAPRRAPRPLATHSRLTGGSPCIRARKRRFSIYDNAPGVIRL